MTLTTQEVAQIIADGVVAWADEPHDLDASRYPIPPWTVYEAIAERVLDAFGPEGGSDVA